MTSIGDFDRAVLSILRVLLDSFPLKETVDVDALCEELFGEMPALDTMTALERNSGVVESRRSLVFSTAEWLGSEGYIRFEDDGFIEPNSVKSGRLPPARLTAKALAVLRIQVDSLDGKVDLATEAVSALRDGSRSAVSNTVSKILGMGAGLGSGVF